MSEKRFKTKYYLKSRQGVVLGVVKVNEEENVLSWGKVVDLLNSLTEENEQLREINKEISDDLHNCRLNKNIIREKLKLWQEVHKEYNIYSIKDFEELLNEQQARIEMLEKGILDCLFNNKSIGMLAEEMRLVE